MKKNILFYTFFLATFIMVGCNTTKPKNTTTANETRLAAVEASPIAKEPETAPQTAVKPATETSPDQLPIRFQRPSYVLAEPEKSPMMGLEQDEKVVIPVGADISSNAGPVPLRDILKKLASLKNMNISWSSDVDQFAQVDVDIRADEDFFDAIGNILRQLDYFHETKNNTIIVKYKETRKFHIAMPFTSSTYKTGLGGNVLGGESIKGTVSLESNKNEFDIWKNIQTNMDQILEIVTEEIQESKTLESSAQDTTTAAGDTTKDKEDTRAKFRKISGKGYYTIDRPIGLITVTAPRPLVEKIATYLNNLKTEIFRQISIEAKIVEVTLTDTSTIGINWTNILSNKSIDFELFGSTGVIYAPDTANRAISKISLTNPFSMVLDAIATEGDTNVLANPKISVLNGQPALISVGSNATYIDKVETTVSESGAVTQTITTSSIMSGLGLGVVATIMGNDEVVLSLTPVTSQLEGGTVTYENFGSGTTASKVGVPVVNLRELNTTVKIKSGDMLIVGGLIDESDTTTDTKVPVLGDIPMAGKLFKSSKKTKTQKELVVLLLPKIM